MNQKIVSPTQGRWVEGEHRFAVRVYYEDTDFTGVVYHANYLKFFERGRTEALRDCGVSHTDLFKLDPPLGFVVRKIDVEFRIPARVDDSLQVRTVFDNVRGARLMIVQTLFRGDEIIATAHVEAACIDLAGRPKRLPADMIALLKDRLAV